jgi:hypothetical protein
LLYAEIEAACATGFLMLLIADFAINQDGNMPLAGSAGEGESGEASVSRQRAMHAHAQFPDDAIDR